MSINAEIFERELFDSPTEVMQQYLAHFRGDAHTFLNALVKAAGHWEQYQNAAGGCELNQEELGWSAAYFFNAINSALVSTRLFLSGYIVPSGNLSRQALESLAFATLLAFPDTGAFREWKKGHASEHKALGRLAKHARHCGVTADNARELDRQSKWFDQYSHPSRLALATIITPSRVGDTEANWNIGALFVGEFLEQYRKEMANRISLAELLTNAIAGTHAELIDRKMIGS